MSFIASVIWALVDLPLGSGTSHWMLRADNPGRPDTKMGETKKTTVDTVKRIVFDFTRRKGRNDVRIVNAVKQRNCKVELC